MSVSTAFLILGGAQAIIYFVLKRFVQQAVTDRPLPLLRYIVGLTGVVAAVLLLGAAYFALFVP